MVLWIEVDCKISALDIEHDFGRNWTGHLYELLFKQPDQKQQGKAVAWESVLPKGKAAVGLVSVLDAHKSTEMNPILNAPFVIGALMGHESPCQPLSVRQKTAGSQAEGCLLFSQSGADLDLWKQEWWVK